MRAAVTIGLALVAGIALAQTFPPEQVKRGAELYETHCVTCHGVRMKGAEWGADLRVFPKDQRARFVDTVTHVKVAMPPWGDVLKPPEIEALWAYVVAGERD